MVIIFFAKQKAHNYNPNILMLSTNCKADCSYDRCFEVYILLDFSKYASDVSKKTKAARKAKARDDQFIGSKAPFGYNIDLTARHHLIVDESAA